MLNISYNFIEYSTGSEKYDGCVGKKLVSVSVVYFRGHVADWELSISSLCPASRGNMAPQITSLGKDCHSNTISSE